MLNLNTPNKQWNMYLNTLSSISGDNLTIKPDARRNLLLEVSGNNNIFIKKGDVSYNLTNLITGDTSFSNVDISVNLNPLTNNNGSLGSSNKLWSNAYIRNISATNISISGNMTISGTISNVIQIIPRLANDISTSLGTNTNIWQQAFIRDLSNISTINGSTWPLTLATGATGATGPTGPTGQTGPAGLELRVSLNTTLTDISNFRLTTKNRIYQEISGHISWNAVNGYYGLAQHAYPSLNPLSSGVKAVQNWRLIPVPNMNSLVVCWSPELGKLVFIDNTYDNTIKVFISSNAIDYTETTFSLPGAVYTNWTSICWSPELKIFLACGMLSNYSATPSSVALMRSSDGVIWTDSTFTHASGVTQPASHAWSSICWSPELSLFVVVGYSRSWRDHHGGTTYCAYIASSSNGINWQPLYLGYSIALLSVCWSPQLKIFIAVGNQIILRSTNGITWINDQKYQVYPAYYGNVIWSPEVGIFVAGERGSIALSGIHTSNDGITWIQQTIPSLAHYNDPLGISWSPQLRIFFVPCNAMYQLISNNGITWEAIFIPSLFSGGYIGPSQISWCPELGIFYGAAYNGVFISSLKGRPPTSYNVFDSSFNSIDENGKWDFSNINVTYLTANGASVSSDDRLKHNEVVINNGLDIIDQLSPKFYQKTQVLLDASYNGDLSNYAWNYEAGLIAQELLQISDLSFTVGGGDYYEQTYNLIKQTNDLSNSYYDLSNSYYDLSNSYYDLSNANYKLRYNYYEPSANNYDISNNLIIQAYNLNYNSVFVYGLAAIKELHAKVKAQETSILDEQLNDLVTRVEALESSK